MTATTTQDGLLASIDAAAQDPVVVLAPPPSDRALRLLVTDPSATAVEQLLRDCGYLPHGRRWARFSGSSIAGVFIRVGSSGRALSTKRVDKSC